MSFYVVRLRNESSFFRCEVQFFKRRFRSVVRVTVQLVVEQLILIRHSASRRWKEQRSREIGAWSSTLSVGVTACNTA